MLTGPEKAVLFLLSLDEEAARPIVRELGEDELRKMRAVAATMHEVPSGALEATFREFLERAATAVAVPRGGLAYLRRISAGALGEARAAAVFEEGVTSPFARLEAAPPDAVATLLADEPPQLAAAVLARLQPDAAAAILTAMPSDRQHVVVQYVSRLTELPASVLEDVANALVAELPTADAQTLVGIDGVARAAALLNAAGAGAAAVLQNLEGEDPDLAMEVRQAMFTFDDLKRLDSRAMREILREVPTERLVLALKDASPEVTRVVFSGLSARAADLIRDDLEVLGRVRKGEVDAARREVVETALRLEAQGAVDLGRDGA